MTTSTFPRNRVTFSVALIIALVWLLFSVWVADPWMRALGDVTHPYFALIALTFIAFVPGFMNAFLLISLALDRRPARVQPISYPPVSILIAAFQESGAIDKTLASLAQEQYPGQLEILVLDDGSTDGTSEAAHASLAANAFPPNASTHIIRFPTNAGKAAVLNQGLSKAAHDLIITIDADTIVRPNAITNIVERLLSDPPETQAVAGAVMVGNSRRSIITGAQEWDYFHGIAAVKRMQSMYHGTLVAQGAFSIYRRGALEAIGGWAP